tara:strand:+ start:2912 stop:3751 length:840 start_codon:yes stop_codon:yes gene_type:complete
MNSKFDKLLAKHGGGSWMISEQGLANMKARLDCVDFDSISLEALDEFGPEYDYMGNELARPGFLKESSVFMVPINGPLIKGADNFDKVMGAIGHDDVRQFIQAGIDADADTILLNINSPGGTVLGTPELADFISSVAADRQVALYTETMVASAAEYIGAAASVHIATPSAVRGSIGVIMTHVSFQEMMEKEGVKVDLITSGEHKGAGHPYKNLTEEQRELFQAEVDILAGTFKDHMRINRPGIKEEAMQGQTFTGAAAQASGFTDIVVGSFAEAVEIVS